MNLRKQEDVLLAQWATNRLHFARDGIVDLTSFLETRPRVVFLLKEVNYTSSDQFDLRDFLQKGGRGMTWNTVVRWTRIIHTLHPASSFTDPNPQRRSVTGAERRALLRTLAIVNVKKQPGNHRASVKIVREAALKDRHFIDQQLALYGWQVLVAGGLDATTVIDPIPGLSGGHWHSSGAAFPYKLLSGNRLVIRTPHPAARLAITDMNAAMHRTLTQAVAAMKSNKTTSQS